MSLQAERDKTHWTLRKNWLYSLKCDLPTGFAYTSRDRLYQSDRKVNDDSNSEAGAFYTKIRDLLTRLKRHKKRAREGGGGRGRVRVRTRL